MFDGSFGPSCVASWRVGLVVKQHALGGVPRPAHRIRQLLGGDRSAALQPDGDPPRVQVDLDPGDRRETLQPSLKVKRSRRSGEPKHFDYRDPCSLCLIRPGNIQFLNVPRGPTADRP